MYGKFESILCGNKVDLESNREVKFDTLKEYGIKEKKQIIETSAKTGANLDKAFRMLVDLILKGRTDEELISEFGATSGGLNLQKKQKEKKGKWC